MFRLLGYRDASQSLQIFAHEMVQRWMLDGQSANVPTDTYFREKYTLYLSQ